MENQRHNYTEGSFSVEHSSKSPLHTFYNYRMNQLQSKVHFYQGQVDPLLNDNLTLKEKFTTLSRIVSISTDILRKLLPTGDPTTKMKIYMAGLEELTIMMESQHGWLNEELQNRSEELRKAREQIAGMEGKYMKMEMKKDESMFLLREECQKVQNQLRERLAKIEGQTSLIMAQKDSKIEDLQNNFRRVQQQFKSLAYDLQQQRRISARRSVDHQRSLRHLNDKISSHQRQTQQAKNRVKALCQKLMTQKLQEQAEVYEHMLKNKEQEKMAVVYAKQDQQMDLNRIIEKKDESIRNLTGMLQKNRGDSQKLNDRLYVINEELAEEKRKCKEMEEQMYKLRKYVQWLQSKVKILETTIKEESQKMTQLIQQHQQEKVTMEEQHQKEVNALMGEREALAEQIQQNSAKMEQLQNTVGESEGQWTSKIDKLKVQWQDKINFLNEELALKSKAIEDADTRIKRLKEQNQTQLKQMQRGHLFIVQNLEVNAKRAKDDLKRQHQLAMRRMKQTNQEELFRVKMDHSQELLSAKEEAQRKMKGLITEVDARIHDETLKYIKQIQQLQVKLTESQKETKVVQAKLSKAESKITEYDKQIEDVKLGYIKRIRKMQEDSQEEKKKMTTLLEEQIKGFQKEIESQVNNMGSKQDELRDIIQQLKQETGVAQIERKCEKEVRQIKKRFNYDLEQMSHHFDKNIALQQEEHQRILDKAAMDNERKQEELKDEFVRLTACQEKEFKRILLKIADRLEGEDSPQRVRVVLHINKDEDIETTSLDKFQDYIHSTTQILHHRIKQKIEQISRLQSELYIKIKQIQQFQKNYDKVLDSKLKNKREQFEFMKRELLARMEAVTSDCRAKLETAYKEKVQYTNELRKDFQQLKKEHGQKYKALELKYIELETLFGDRPSRDDDIATIKNLQKMKDKMDFEVKSYQKKAETANQIVKYLNLQLENYKDTYQIFGANVSNDPVNPTKTKTGSIFGDSPKKNKDRDNKSQKSDIFQRYEKKPKKLEALGKFNEDYNSLVKEANSANSQSPDRKLSSPFVKEVNIFGGVLEKSESDYGQSNDEMSSVRSRNVSLPMKRGSLKTEQNQPKDEEIITYAEKFMSLMKIPSKEKEQAQEERQKDNDKNKDKDKDKEGYLGKKRTIRRRTVSKRVATLQAEHFF